MKGARKMRQVREKRSRKGQRGFTVLEVLLAIFILLVAIGPLINAYRPSLFSALTEQAQTVFVNQARQTLNRVASLDFDTLWNNQGNPVNLGNLFTASDETFSLNGVSYSPTVSIVDSSGGAGGLVEITVAISGVTLKTLKADY